MTDAERLDYLDWILRARMGFVDVNLSGVRETDAEATAVKIDLPGKLTLQAPAIREAIDECAKKYPRVRM